jgi:hypothetical protein
MAKVRGGGSEVEEAMSTRNVYVRGWVYVTRAQLHVCVCGYLCLLCIMCVVHMNVRSLILCLCACLCTCMCVHMRVCVLRCCESLYIYVYVCVSILVWSVVGFTEGRFNNDLSVCVCMRCTSLVGILVGFAVGSLVGLPVGCDSEAESEG